MRTCPTCRMDVPLRTFLSGPLGGRTYVVCRGCAAHLHFSMPWYLGTGALIAVGLWQLARRLNGNAHPFWWFFGLAIGWSWLCLLVWWCLAPLRAVTVDEQQ